MFCFYSKILCVFDKRFIHDYLIGLNIEISVGNLFFALFYWNILDIYLYFFLLSHIHQLCDLIVAMANILMPVED